MDQTLRKYLTKGYKSTVICFLSGKEINIASQS